MQKTLKYLTTFLLSLALIISFTGCSKSASKTSTTSANPTATSNNSDEFIPIAYKYLTTTKGYDATFATGLIAIMLTESNGDPQFVEFSNKYGEEKDNFIKSSDSDKDTALTAYHEYGEIILKNNEANTDAYKDSDGNFCPGVGLLLWTGNRGNDLIGSAYDINDKWTSLDYQLKYITRDLEKAELRPTDDIVKNIKSNEDAIDVIAYNFLMIPKESPQIDHYKEKISQVTSVVDNYPLDNVRNVQ